MRVARGVMMRSGFFGVGLAVCGLSVMSGMPLSARGAAAPAAQTARASQAMQPTAPRRTLMAVFAHPDDEQVASAALARYAREGVRVVLVIATDGRNGANEFAKIPAGDALAKARAGEAACAAGALHIEPPILLGLEDGTALVPAKEGGAAVMRAVANHARLAKEVTRLFTEYQPEIVVTWGPDGGTGHTDHRLVSAIVTQAFQQGSETSGAKSDGAGWPRQLYYAGIPAERLAAAKLPADIGLFGVAMRFLTVRVPYTDADFEAARASLACHKTQYTPEQAEGMMQMSKALGAGTAFFRPWTGGSIVTDDLFAKN